MSEPEGTEPDSDRVEQRAGMLPEEQEAGIDDPELMAKVLLEDSDARTDAPERTKHESTQTPD